MNLDASLFLSGNVADRGSDEARSFSIDLIGVQRDPADASVVLARHASSSPQLVAFRKAFGLGTGSCDATCSEYGARFAGTRTGANGSRAVELHAITLGTDTKKPNGSFESAPVDYFDVDAGEVWTTVRIHLDRSLAPM
jgi:hypothetical protein